MPEFILDHGTQESARAFRDLDSFTQGYIEAMFFTDCESNTVRDEEHIPTNRWRVWNPETDSNLPGDVSVADLAPSTLAAIIEDCQRFQTGNADLIQRACDHNFQYDDASAGRDFWYSRNGHGVGFWDRGLGDIGDQLHAAAASFGNADCCLGHDGLIYF